jgi:hypothetical protein
LREAVKVAGAKSRVALASIGGGVAVFGRDAELMAALAPFGPAIDGEIALDPTDESWALGLLYEALTKALARGRPLRPLLSDRRGHALISASPPADRHDDRTNADRRLLGELEKGYQGRLFGTVPKIGRRYAEAIDVRLEFWLGRWWCVMTPFTWVERPARAGDAGPQRDPDIDALADWRRERWARRYNAAWNNIIDGWAHLLVSDKQATISSFGIGESEGIDASFTARQMTGWCRPGRFSLEGRQ